MPNTPTDKARAALAAWDALDPQRDAVSVQMEQAHEGEGSLEEADSTRFDLWEQEADMGYELAARLQELVAHHEALLRRLPGGRDF